MDFTISDEQKLLRESIVKFAQGELNDDVMVPDVGAGTEDPAAFVLGDLDEVEPGAEARARPLPPPPPPRPPGPPPVASAAPELRPNRLMATATASSKKLLAPISAEGPAITWVSPTARLAR